MGLSYAILYFSSNISFSIAERIDIIYSALIISVLSGIIFSTIGFRSDSIFYHFFNSYELSQAIKYCSLGLIFFPSNKVLLSGLNGLGEIRFHSIFQALRSILLIVCLIVLINMNIEPYLLISTFVLTELLLFIMILSYYLYTFKLPRIIALINHLHKVIVFGFKSFLNPLLTEFYPKIDIILVGFFFNDKVVGIYSIASIFIEG